MRRRQSHSTLPAAAIQGAEHVIGAKSGLAGPCGDLVDKIGVAGEPRLTQDDIAEEHAEALSVAAGAFGQNGAHLVGHVWDLEGRHA